MPTFDTFTLADIRASVRTHLGDLGYDADTIDEAANDFQYELFNDNRSRLMEESTTLTVSEDDTEIDFPDDWMAIINLIVYYSATQHINITDDILTYGDFMKSYANFAIATASRPRVLAPFGDGMRLSAPSDGSYTLLLDYLRVPRLMENDSDESELPRAYKEMHVLGTLEKVLAIDEELDSADFNLDRLQGHRTSFIRNYGRGSSKLGPRRINSRRGRGAFRADRDF